MTNSQKMPLLEAPLNPLATAPQAEVKKYLAMASAAQALISAKSAFELEDTRDHGPIPEDKDQENNDGENHTITNYKVVAGDTVTSIAEKYGISVNTVLWANDLRRDSKLIVGKNLTILPITGVKYEVEPGDTLSSIALKFKSDSKEIFAYNELGTDKLRIGDVIVIPDGEIAPTATLAKAQTSSGNIAQKAVTTALGVNIAKADVPEGSGYYMRPILAGTKTQGIHGSNGVDLADSCGTPIYAAASGEVTLSKGGGAWNGGYGNYVVISHPNGSQTLYAHMQSVALDEGVQVEKGQAIGTIGATGKVHGTTGCHVHFEVRGGGRNPF
ncbi:peptidoglycan DD-metalloendopeptidase family protein [Candidatus Parcubacteria bacterium]|nr:peptidoglycan DD-metalloendopeptidase family protein [Candidatus Parcubacteria bacterium]